MTLDLRNRLLLLLVAPLCALALLAAWWDYRSAGDAASQHDQRLARLLPALADSVLPPAAPGDAPLLLLAPPVEEFLRQHAALAAYAVMDRTGDVVAGEDWLRSALPTTGVAEFHSREHAGVTYRIAVQRAGRSGEWALALADGSDPRQQWAQHIVQRVLLPYLLLMVVAGLTLRWAVQRAFKPLLDLAEAVERRSPSDLHPIDEAASPDEVRPLVRSLNRLLALVSAQSESQRRFVADAAHQLRTPLAALQSQVEAWAQMVPSDGKTAPGHTQSAQGALFLRADQVLRLRDATRRTSQLAHQLLALSRVDASGAQAQPQERIDLKDLCETLLETFLDAATAKGIDLGLQVQTAHTTGHGWLLRELLANVVDNAIKYTPAGGSVTLRCAPGIAGGGPMMQVEDDGPGVPEAARVRLTERFYRVPASPGEGSGLGLAIAAEIAAIHGAALALQPGARGQGLCVTLTFAQA